MTTLMIDATKCSRCSSTVWEVIDPDENLGPPTTHLQTATSQASPTTTTCTYQSLSDGKPCGQAPAWFCLHAFIASNPDATLTLKPTNQLHALACPHEKTYFVNNNLLAMPTFVCADHVEFTQCPAFQEEIWSAPLVFGQTSWLSDPRWPEITSIGSFTSKDLTDLDQQTKQYLKMANVILVTTTLHTGPPCFSHLWL